MQSCVLTSYLALMIRFFLGALWASVESLGANRKTSESALSVHENGRGTEGIELQLW